MHTFCNLHNKLNEDLTTPTTLALKRLCPTRIPALHVGSAEGIKRREAAGHGLSARDAHSSCRGINPLPLAQPCVPYVGVFYTKPTSSSPFGGQRMSRTHCEAASFHVDLGRNYFRKTNTTSTGTTLLPTLHRQKNKCPPASRCEKKGPFFPCPCMTWEHGLWLPTHR